MTKGADEFPNLIRRVDKNTPAVPEGCVQLTEKEARMHMYQLIFKWRPKSDVWPFTYGLGILSGASGLMAAFINKHYRYALNMRNHVLMATSLPVITLPMLSVLLFHSSLVSSNILIHNDSCQTCVYTRSMLIQGSCAIYPILLSSLGNLQFAGMLHVAAVPSVFNQPKLAFQHWLKLTKPIKNVIFVGTILQLFLSIFITHKEYKSVHLISKKIDELENQE